VNGDGLTTMQLPATSAGAIFQTASRIGKFHGVMPPTAPSGVWRVITRSGALTGTSPHDAVITANVAARLRDHCGRRRRAP
jgi:hypothetical protein